MRYNIAAVGLSDIGKVRQNNEDVWAEIPSLQFYVLADGMGGHQAGEVAAREAVDCLCALITDLHENTPGQVSLQELRRNISWIIEEVNAVVYQKGRSNQSLRGMGTTLCCMHFHKDGMVYAHVGDSRIYRLRNKKMIQLTKDHSLLRQLIDAGQVSEKRAPDFAYKNIITKAIGTEASVDPSVHSTQVEENDIYMMCSDGLSDLLSTKDIERVFNETTSITLAAKKLVDKANEIGGHDNITLVIAKIELIHEDSNLPR